MYEDLNSQARKFAKQTSDLLNNTVTNGIRVSVVATTAGECIIGRNVTTKRLTAEPIPLSTSSYKASVYLYWIHSYSLDSEERYLTMTSSTMSAYTSVEMNDSQLIVGIDYTRSPKNKYPGSHLHVGGERNDLDDIYHGKRKSRKLRDLHLPVGGKRFRPILEDLIEFLIIEEFVEPHTNWQTTLNEHRKRWERIQLKAAVRRNQSDAAAALKEAGWCVSF